LVDLSLSKEKSKGGGFPTLDVKVRNRGSVSALLKRARVEVVDRVQYSDCQLYFALAATWTYQVNLAKPQPIELAQVVPAGGVDRFLFVLGHELRRPDLHVLYRLRLHLVYDEDDKELVSKDFTVHVPGMAERMASTARGDKEYERCVEETQRKIAPARKWPISYSMPNYFKEE
jgi:hypothetical protein